MEEVQWNPAMLGSAPFAALSDDMPSGTAKRSPAAHPAWESRRIITAKAIALGSAPLSATANRSKNHAPQSPESNRRPYCTRLACFNAFIITFAAGDNSLSDRVMIPKASIWHGISSGSTVTIPCAA